VGSFKMGMGSELRNFKVKIPTLAKGAKGEAP
jgi:hypothetical protein